MPALADTHVHTVSYSCDQKSGRLIIGFTLEYNRPSRHMPERGFFDPAKLAWREETKDGQYKFLGQPAELVCRLGDRTYNVLIEGHFFAGSPMAQCGVGNTAAVWVFDQNGHDVFPKQPLEDCYTRGGVTTKIVIDSRAGKMLIEKTDADRFGG